MSNKAKREGTLQILDHPLGPQERLRILFHIFDVQSWDSLPSNYDEATNTANEEGIHKECYLGGKHLLPSGHPFDRILVSVIKEHNCWNFAFSLGDILAKFEVSCTINSLGVIEKISYTAPRKSKNFCITAPKYNQNGAFGKNGESTLLTTDTFLSMCDVPKHLIEDLPEKHHILRDAHFFDPSLPEDSGRSF